VNDVICLLLAVPLTVQMHCMLCECYLIIIFLLLDWLTLGVATSLGNIHCVPSYASVIKIIENPIKI